MGLCSFAAFVKNSWVVVLQHLPLYYILLIKEYYFSQKKRVRNIPVLIGYFWLHTEWREKEMDPVLVSIKNLCHF